jgi:hypothetical protein
MQPFQHKIQKLAQLHYLFNRLPLLYTQNIPVNTLPFTLASAISTAKHYKKDERAPPADLQTLDFPSILQ